MRSHTTNWRGIFSALVGMLALICVAAAAEDLSDAKRADILKLQEVSGQKAVNQQATQRLLDRMVEQARKARPGVSERVLQIIREELEPFIVEKFSASGGLFEQQAEIAHAHFTHEEIRALLDFYATPLGQKLAREQPAMAAEGQKLVESFVTQLLPQVMQRVRDALQRGGLSLQD